MRTFCQRTVGAYISGNIQVSKGDVRTISAGDAGTQTFERKTYKHGTVADKPEGPVFPRRAPEEVAEARRKTHEYDRKRLIEFCTKVDDMQEEVKKAYGSEFDAQTPSIKMHWLNMHETYPSCT